MTHTDIFTIVEKLRAQNRSFCLATVVRTADVTSAKAGAKAAITDDGVIHGHLGGACVQRAVKEVAEEILTAGTPRLIRVKPSEKVVSLTDQDGVDLFKSGCPSGGTVDVLIEAFLPAPRLVVVGEGPVSAAIAAHAELMDFRVYRIPSGKDPLPELDHQDFVVIATQGRNDAVALETVLRTNARFVSMIASRRKAETLIARLMDKGVDAETLQRLKAPAGLYIGGIDPNEIAVSVLAEVIQFRRTEVSNEHPVEQART